MSSDDPIVARDKRGKQLHINDRVRYVGDSGRPPVRVVGIGTTPCRADERAGGYEYLPVRIVGYGWVNPVARCVKVAEPRGRRRRNGR